MSLFFVRPAPTRCAVCALRAPVLPGPAQRMKRTRDDMALVTVPEGGSAGKRGRGAPSEEDATGVVQLPKNAKTVRFKFSLSNLTQVEREDVQLVTNVISYVAHHIAQKHQDVTSWVSTQQETLKGVKLTKYVVYMEMPMAVGVPDSHQLAGIHELALELIVEPIKPKVKDSHTLSLTVPIYSKKNPYVVEVVHITHIVVKRLVSRAHDEEDETGSSVKRPRRS